MTREYLDALIQSFINFRDRSEYYSDERLACDKEIRRLGTVQATLRITPYLERLKAAA